MKPEEKRFRRHPTARLLKDTKSNHWYTLPRWFAQFQGVYCCDGHRKRVEALQHGNALFDTKDWA